MAPTEARGTHNPLVVGSIPTEPTKTHHEWVFSGGAAPPSTTRTYTARRTGDDNRPACHAYLAWLAQHGRKQLTVYQYGGKLESLCTELGPTWLGDVNLTFLETFIGRDRRGGKAGSPATRSRDVTLLRGFYRWAKAHALVTVDPTLELDAPRVRNANPRAIPDSLWCKVWLSGVPSDAERVVLGLGYFAGLRRSEVCALEVSHVDLELGRIVGFPRKGDASDRTSGVVPLGSCLQLFHERAPRVLGHPSSLLDPLRRVCEARSGQRWLLGWGEQAQPWRRSEGRHGAPDAMTNPDQLNKRLMRLLVKCDLAPDAFTPHALRHSFVTQLVQMNIPLHVVSRMANHSSPTVTMRYVRTALDPLAEFLGRAEDGRLGGSRW
jgi:integrase